VWKGRDKGATVHGRGLEWVYTSEAIRVQTGVCDRLPVEIGVCGGGVGCVCRQR
jgi:hypothetical protein